MKVAIVHDWLVTYAGAERVLNEILQSFPKADIYTIVDHMPAKHRDFIRGRNIYTSFIQKLPYSQKYYRNYLPLMPIAIEQFNLSSYDLIISSSHAVAKGILISPHQLHICMCYSPIRYAWDMQHEYLDDSNLQKGLSGFIAKLILHKIRLWDVRTANSVDHFIAISDFISKRIEKVYRRKSIVIYPPVDIDNFNLSISKESFYVTASRMVPYKKIDLIVEAFTRMPEHKLIVIGDGPDFNKIRAKAGSNVKLLGFQPQNVLIEYLQKSRAFIFASQEDFGIAPLEAQACGTPVIAYGKGGVLETIIDINKSKVTGKDPTGLFFEEQTAESICNAVKLFEAIKFRFEPEACRKNSLRFSSERFRSEFNNCMDVFLKDVNFQ